MWGKYTDTKFIRVANFFEISRNPDLSRTLGFKIFPLQWDLLYKDSMQKIILFRSTLTRHLQHVPFKSYSGFLETPYFGLLILDHPETDQDRGNWLRWVQWWCLFSVSRRFKTIILIFSNFQISLLYTVKNRYFENLKIIVLNRLETENKHHHWTQRSQLPLSWSVSGWSKINRPK
jgi:hypothetical protein